ncbi:MAG: hypothetical protein KatS3mg022_1972 [Armatimonadota bacterium]|nr:MAG: hypothetical protein KatS3mg022_1972 [Armatimonadota bacterium]
MSRQHLCILLTVLLLVSTNALADEDVLDPKADPRLEKMVSVFQPPAPLSAVVKALSAPSGVLLTTERSVSEYRAILVAEERPLHEVMRRLAEAFGFTWERKGKEGEPPIYMLVQPASDAAREAAELREMERLADEIWRYAAAQAAKWATVGKKEVEQRMEQLRQTYEARLKEGKLSRAEIVSVLREAYAIAASQQPWRRAATLALASLSPAQMRQLRAGNIQRVTGDALSPEALKQILAEWREAEVPAPPPPIGAEQPDTLEPRMEKPYQSQHWNNVEVWLFPDPGAGNIKALVYFISPEARKGGSQVHEVTPSAWDLYIQINGLLRGMIAPRLPESPIFQKATKAAEFRRNSNDYLSDPIGVELAHFARANRVPLAAEWYPFSLGGMPGARAVQAVATWGEMMMQLRDYSAEITASEEWVLVRSFARAVARRTNIPHSQIARWLLKPQAEGRLTLDDVAEIAFLHERQQQNLGSTAWRLLHHAPSGEGYLGGLDTPIQFVKNNPRALFALQAYALLSTAQKRVLLSGQPVALTAMTRQVAARLQVAAALPDTSAQSPSLFPDETAQMALVIHTEQSEAERIDLSRVPEEMLEVGAFRPWLESLSPEERAKVMQKMPILRITLGLTDGERLVALAQVGTIQ